VRAPNRAARNQRSCMMPPLSCDTIRRAKIRRGEPSAASVCGRRRRSCESLRAACTGRCKAGHGGSRAGKRGNTLKKRAEGRWLRRWERAVTCIPLMHCVSLTWQPRRDVSVRPYLTAAREAAAAALGGGRLTRGREDHSLRRSVRRSKLFCRSILWTARRDMCWRKRDAAAQRAAAAPPASQRTLARAFEVDVVLVRRG
jgi:hypothetical protein